MKDRSQMLKNIKSSPQCWSKDRRKYDLKMISRWSNIYNPRYKYRITPLHRWYTYINLLTIWTKNYKIMTKIYKIWPNYDQKALRTISLLVHRIWICASLWYHVANYLQKFLPTGPQHNFVARPQATSAGSRVLCRLDYEILVLLL